MQYRREYQALYSYRLIFDFKDDTGALGYLRGREVSIDARDIWFASDFPRGAEIIESLKKN